MGSSGPGPLRGKLRSKDDPKNLELVGGVPWRTSPDQCEVVMPAISMPTSSDDKVDRPTVQEFEYVHRCLYIKKTGIETHGKTPTGAGSAWLRCEVQEERCTLRNAARVSPKRSTRRRMDETVCDRQRFAHSSLRNDESQKDRGARRRTSAGNYRCIIFIISHTLDGVGVNIHNEKIT